MLCWRGKVGRQPMWTEEMSRAAMKAILGYLTSSRDIVQAATDDPACGGSGFLDSGIS
jgi:hypothetical protein